MRLFIEPVDVWLFRDGRPFSAGSDHRARSQFPPYPTVVQGAFRSHYLVVQDIDLHDPDAIRDAVGTATDYRDLRIKGPFVAKRENGKVMRYFPVPFDAVQRGGQLQSLVPQDKEGAGIRSSAPTPRLLWDDGQPEKRKGEQWLSESELLHYLDGSSVTPVLAEDLFRRESRFGIGLDDDTRTTRQEEGGGLLYEVEFIRPCENVGLEVEMHGLPGWPSSGVMRLGGEGRAGRFGASNAPAWPAFPDPLPDRFKVYFATPAYFTDGWRPASWNGFFDGNVRLIAAAVGRYESVGGFDLAKGDHKPARRYVPAGSVYYFECLEKSRVRQELVNQAITDVGAEIGFGQIIIRRWKDV